MAAIEDELQCGPITAPAAIGGYLYDFTWSTYPLLFLENSNWATTPYEIVLAAEIEQKKQAKDGRGGAYRLIMDSFCRLLDARARMKIMVYRPQFQRRSEAHWQSILDGFEELLRRHRYYDSKETWLFIGVPRGLHSRCRLHVVEADSGGKPTLVERLWELDSGSTVT